MSLLTGVDISFEFSSCTGVLVSTVSLLGALSSTAGPANVWLHNVKSRAVSSTKRYGFIKLALPGDSSSNDPHGQFLN